LGKCPLEVTAEQAREVVRLLEAATESANKHAVIRGPWGQ
jgi:scyllo-inositol 2-dehydrogenase (NADP+)